MQKVTSICHYYLGWRVGASSIIVKFINSEYINPFFLFMSPQNPATPYPQALRFINVAKDIVVKYNIFQYFRQLLPYLGF